MVARRNVLILFMELKDLSAVAVVTGIVKRTVGMKEMFGYNSASNVVVNELGGSVPQTNGLSNACIQCKMHHY